MNKVTPDMPIYWIKRYGFKVQGSSFTRFNRLLVTQLINCKDEASRRILVGVDKELRRIDGRGKRRLARAPKAFLNKSKARAKKPDPDRMMALASKIRRVA